MCRKGGGSHELAQVAESGKTVASRLMVSKWVSTPDRQWGTDWRIAKTLSWERRESCGHCSWIPWKIRRLIEVYSLFTKNFCSSNDDWSIRDRNTWIESSVVIRSSPENIWATRQAEKTNQTPSLSHCGSGRNNFGSTHNRCISGYREKASPYVRVLTDSSRHTGRSLSETTFWHTFRSTPSPHVADRGIVT